MRTAALFFFASCFSAGWASPTSDYYNSVRSASSQQELVKALSAMPPELSQDPNLDPQLPALARRTDWRRAQRDAERLLQSRLWTEHQSAPGRIRDAAKESKRILQDPRYYDPGPTGQRNWMSRAVQRILDWIRELFNKLDAPKPTVMGGGSFAPAFLVPIVWILLGLGLLFFLGFFIYKFSFAGAVRRKKVGVLSEDEEALSSDEWLVRARELEAKGEFREAVRCLYLAVLLRLDEAAILRFVRHETNWEHLKRYERAQRQLTDFDLRTLTKLFDRVWYGQIVEGPRDVQLVRDTYTALLETLKRGAAA